MTTIVHKAFYAPFKLVSTLVRTPLFLFQKWKKEPNCDDCFQVTAKLPHRIGINWEDWL